MRSTEPEDGGDAIVKQMQNSSTEGQYTLLLRFRKGGIYSYIPPRNERPCTAEEGVRNGMPPFRSGIVCKRATAGFN